MGNRVGAVVPLPLPRCNLPHAESPHADGRQRTRGKQPEAGVPSLGFSLPPRAQAQVWEGASSSLPRRADAEAPVGGGLERQDEAAGEYDGITERGSKRRGSEKRAHQSELSPVAVMGGGLW